MVGYLDFIPQPCLHSDGHSIANGTGYLQTGQIIRAVINYQRIQEGPEDPKDAHLISIAPFKDNNIRLHTDVCFPFMSLCQSYLSHCEPIPEV